MNFEGITHPQLTVRSSHELQGETFFHLDLKCVGNQSLLIQQRYLIDKYGSRKADVHKVQIKLCISLGVSSYNSVIDERCGNLIQPVGRVDWFSSENCGTLNFGCFLKESLFWNVYRALTSQNSKIFFDAQLINVSYGNNPDGLKLVWDTSETTDSEYTDDKRYLKTFSLREECNAESRFNE